MIRKTTAIWLFQESERVSADRLFRVRDKQPFATSTSKAPDIPNYTVAKALPVIQVGELCVMKASDSWKLGRVLQFAKYDSSKKFSKSYQDKYVAVSAKDVRVLCSWYEPFDDDNSMFQLSKESIPSYIPLDSYICSIPEDGIEVIHDIDDDESSLNTSISQQTVTSLVAKQFMINEDCLASLNQMIESYNNTGSNSGLSDNPIVISDTSVGSGKSHCWTKCGSIVLSKKDKQSLLSGKELSDLHINGFQCLLKSQFGSIGGLRSTLLQKKSPISSKQNLTLQIIHITISTKVKHWAALQICGDDISLYDSVYTTVAGDARETISQLCRIQQEFVSVNIMNTCKQVGGVDCGLHAIAIMTCLAMKIDPLSVIFDKDELRPHLCNILEQGSVTTFPILRKRKVQSRVFRVETWAVFCICRMPDNGSQMICCDRCDKWFHLDCVGTSSVEHVSWLCSSCRQCSRKS